MQMRDYSVRCLPFTSLNLCLPPTHLGAGRAFAVATASPTLVTATIAHLAAATIASEFTATAHHGSGGGSTAAAALGHHHTGLTITSVAALQTPMFAAGQQLIASVATTRHLGPAIQVNS